MWDTIQKLDYRVRANIASAQQERTMRLTDRAALPLCGLNGEKLYLTGMTALQKKEAELNTLYAQLPIHRGASDTILLDAWSSATIEGARTTVQQVRAHFDHPKTKDDRMVINTIIGSNYAYNHPITGENIRKLWETVVDGVCENQESRGTQYRDKMVYVGATDRIIHIPAKPQQLPALMERLFAYQAANTSNLLIHSFAAHFYFVYLHPFCDGNGRCARILNASQLYHGGYRKMKTLPLSSAINRQLSGYYGSLADSEQVLREADEKWLDLSPFVSYMMDVFERCVIDAALSGNALTAAESTLLKRMNQAGTNAEITVKKAAAILRYSEGSARAVLNGLVEKDYLTADTTKAPFLYHLRQP